MFIHTLTNSKKMLSKNEDIQRRNLITVDRKYSLMNKEVKKQVEAHLENELDYLLGRKEIDLMRKRKIQEVQQSFEKQRIGRILKMDEKISRSDKNRTITLREKQSKSRRNLQFVDQKIKKNANIKEEQLQRMLEAQQEYNKRNTVSRTSSKSLDRSSSKHKNSRSLNQNLLKTQLQQSLESIDSRIQIIQSRLDQAKTNQQFYHHQKSEKAKSFYKDFNETMSKINANTSRQETKCIQQYYNRANHIVDCQQRSKSFYEKQSERRKRKIDERFRKCNQNLKCLNSERQSKMQKLTAKLDSNSFAPKSWRNQKEGVYLEKFIINNRKIQLQHSLKADSIINRHFNTGLKNKVLRQKKDKIFQTVRREVI